MGCGRMGAFGMDDNQVVGVKNGLVVWLFKKSLVKRKKVWWYGIVLLNLMI